MSDDGTHVTLRLFGGLREAVGQPEVSLKCVGETVTDTLARFAEERENVRRFIFDGEGNPWPSLILMLNDEPVKDGRTTRVEAGDVVTILLPLAGG